MNKLVIASAAILLSVGGAFAQSASVAVAPQYNDQGLLPTDTAGAKRNAVSAPLSAPLVVAPKYDDQGQLPTDSIAKARTVYNVTAPTGTVAVAPSYNDQGKLPTDK